ERFSLLLHCFGSSFALCFDDRRLGQPAGFVGFSFSKAGRFIDVRRRETFGFGGGGCAGSLGLELKLGRSRQRFDFVTLGVGWLLHVGFQLALFAQNFLLLQLNLLLLLNDAHLHFL